jgi:predicted DNA-binding transcriptional regulator YafY
MDSMRETSARLLELLALLQSRQQWPGAELAGELGVSTRTVRRDVDRLRELGYPVHATQGTAGYRLGAGASLPPLLLNDDEAVALVVGLRTAAGGSVAGVEEASLRVLTKLEQVLPSRLRHRVNTLHMATVRVGGSGGDVPAVSPDALVTIAEACSRHECVRFDYTSPTGGDTVRLVEPHSLVSFDRRWYLVAWDVDRGDWRTFRVDRLALRATTGPRFAPRQIPDGDVATYLSLQLSSRSWPYRATVTLHEGAESVAERVWPGMGVVEPVDDGACLLHLGAESPWALAWMITSTNTDFTLTDGPPELVDALRTQATRCLDALVPDVREPSCRSG